MLPFSRTGLYWRTWCGIRDFYFYNQWILMLGTGDPLSAAFPAFRPVIPPPDRSWADPFVTYRDGIYYIFVEELPRGTRKGHISLIEVDRDLHCSAPVKILERPYHLSYPFVFQWQGEFYMIPESMANRTIEVYRCAEFPDKWTYHGPLMRDVGAVDATLLHHQDRWWMFTNIALGRGASTRDTLFLFFSDQPLSDSWTPHPQNPIVVDLRRARPAGRIFARNGVLYRPSQDSSVRYGYGLRINRITRLNEMEYAEEEVRFIEPGWDRNIIAVHTLNHAHGLIAIDAKWRRWRGKGVPANRA